MIPLKSKRCRSDRDHPAEPADETASEHCRRGSHESDGLGTTLRLSPGFPGAGGRDDPGIAGRAPGRIAGHHPHPGSTRRARPGPAGRPPASLRLLADPGADHRHTRLAGRGLDDPGGRRAQPVLFQRIRRDDRPVPGQADVPPGRGGHPGARVRRGRSLVPAVRRADAHEHRRDHGRGHLARPAQRIHPARGAGDLRLHPLRDVPGPRQLHGQRRALPLADPPPGLLGPVE